ncbi:MAG: hypothetical protein HQL14_00225 [Candidatus Omnitrophica bacterium]|nr:hypothetical protein [Candidatus Omnitrophota bacterium]
MDLLSKPHGLYCPNWNYCPLPFFYGHTIYLYAYTLILILTLIALSLKLIIPSQFKVSLSASCLNISFFVFILLTIAQTSGQHQFLLQRMNLYAKSSAEDKRLLLFPRTYQFIKFTLNHLKNNHYQGKLITDLDASMTVEPFMLQYYLYPKIDLYKNTNQPDCLIIFDKVAPEKLVPKNFKIVGLFDEYCLIATQKRNNE